MKQADLFLVKNERCSVAAFVVMSEGTPEGDEAKFDRSVGLMQEADRMAEALFAEGSEDAEPEAVADAAE